MQKLAAVQENNDLVGTLAHALDVESRLPGPMVAFMPAPGHEPSVLAIETVVARLEHEPARFALEYLTLVEQVRQQHVAYGSQGAALSKLQGEVRDLRTALNAALSATGAQ